MSGHNMIVEISVAKIDAEGMGVHVHVNKEATEEDFKNALGSLAQVVSEMMDSDLKTLRSKAVHVTHQESPDELGH